MKKLFLFLFFPIFCFSQKSDTLTLELCQQKALENYPLLKQKELINKAGEVSILNISKSYLPQLNLNAQATYQSEVTELPINIPGIQIPTLYNDQYKATLDATQLIYDGGITSKQKKLENINTQTELQSLEVELYKIKEKINTIFISIAALQENKKLFLILEKDVTNKLIKVQSGVKNGILLESNAFVLEAEIIKINEQIIEIESGIKTGFKMLADYINQEVDENVILKLPEISIDKCDYENIRPEIKLIEFQQKKLDVSKTLFNSKKLPKIVGFGQVGYGRPGLNMLSNNFNTFYLIGAKLSWNIWDWNQSKNDKQLIGIKSEILNTQKDLFNQGIKILLEKYISDIKKYKDFIVKDNEIIILRDKITKSSESQLENGTITATEYLTELNALVQAKINLESHKIQLIKAEIDYLTVKGSY